MRREIDANDVIVMMMEHVAKSESKIEIFAADGIIGLSLRLKDGTLYETTHLVGVRPDGETICEAASELFTSLCSTILDLQEQN